MMKVKAALREWLFRLDGERFVSAFTIVNRLHWGLPIKLRYLVAEGFYVVTDDKSDGSRLTSLAFSRKERIWVYAKGVLSRVHKLGEVYGLGACMIGPADTVIDCGANIGEFSSLVRARYGCSVISVEPEEDEVRCIRWNAPGVRDVINVALWNETKKLNFFSKNRSADSSLFETAGYDKVTTVQAICLDDLFEKYGLETVKFLKLEAEGAEPEILLGATRSLPQITYISADLGPERGLAKETTIVSVCNFLFGQGFELVSVYPRRNVFLFRNKQH